MTVRIGIVGAAGRMGRKLLKAVLGWDGAVVGAASERMGSAIIGRDVCELSGDGPCGVVVGDSNAHVFRMSDVVIDFTTPVVTMDNLEHAVTFNTPLVIGTTGLDGEGLERVRQAAASVPLVMAPNFSVGVNLMFEVAAHVAKVLGEEWDIEIIEAHHRHKVDAPSGTALRLGEAIAESVGRDFAKVAQFSREGNVGPRDRQAIGFATLRGGTIVGDHTVLFAGEKERFEITHKADDRLIFARGAVRAALWVVKQPPGLYDMRDILGLR